MDVTCTTDRLRLVPYRAEWATCWDDFVNRSQNGTIYHTRRFLTYHPAGRFVDASLLVYHDDQMIAVVPAAVRTCDGIPTLYNDPQKLDHGTASAKVEVPDDPDPQNLQRQLQS